MCSDTVTRSGMFCAMATVIDRCKTEGVVDVFQVVKSLRIQKPGAVPTLVMMYNQCLISCFLYSYTFDRITTKLFMMWLFLSLIPLTRMLTSKMCSSLLFTSLYYHAIEEQGTS